MYTMPIKDITHKTKLYTDMYMSKSYEITIIRALSVSIKATSHKNISMKLQSVFSVSVGEAFRGPHLPMVVIWRPLMWLPSAQVHLDGGLLSNGALHHQCCFHHALPHVTLYDISM